MHTTMMKLGVFVLFSCFLELEAGIRKQRQQAQTDKQQVLVSNVRVMLGSPCIGELSIQMRSLPIPSIPFVSLLFFFSSFLSVFAKQPPTFIISHSSISFLLFISCVVFSISPQTPLCIPPPNLPIIYLFLNRPSDHKHIKHKTQKHKTENTKHKNSTTRTRTKGKKGRKRRNVPPRCIIPRTYVHTRFSQSCVYDKHSTN